ncbi:MAG: sugar ABC transporter permease [Lachnospiraceae bacterium]|jgi:multiple sugar transport system permease protein|nr:sugar ABC transporter permease [Lachnospiraceae bacterium]
MKESKFSKVRAYWNKPGHAAYLFIAPAMLIIFLFVVVPLISSFVISLTNMDIFMRDIKFIGFENFKKSFEEERVWNAFKNTFKYVILSVPIQIGLSLILAFWLFRSDRFSKLMRSIYFIPVICSFASLGIMFKMFFGSAVGYFPYVVSLITKNGVPSFWSDVKYAFPLIIFISVWKKFGQSLIILVAGINSISESYFEAARIDGASRKQVFAYVTIPMLWPTLSFVIVTTVIGAMQVFDVVFVTTGGGPLNSTETIVQYIYSRGFGNSYDLGYASALSVELFFVIALITVLTRKYTDRKMEENS